MAEIATGWEARHWIEDLIVSMAQENPSWAYDRVVGCSPISDIAFPTRRWIVFSSAMALPRHRGASIRRAGPTSFGVLAGIAPYPDQQWMEHQARNVTMKDWGFLVDSRYLLHDGDGKFCPVFGEVIEPARSSP